MTHVQLGTSIGLKHVLVITNLPARLGTPHPPHPPRFLKATWIPWAQTRFPGLYFLKNWLVSRLLFWADDVLCLWEKLGQIQLFHRWRSLCDLGQTNSELLASILPVASSLGSALVQIASHVLFLIHADESHGLRLVGGRDAKGKANATGSLGEAVHSWFSLAALPRPQLADQTLI